MSLLTVVPSVRIALETLRANPLRTLLSTLGIVMGSASLAAVLSLGDGAERFAREQIEDEGLQTVALVAPTADTIDGVRAPRNDYPVFSTKDARELAAGVPAAAQVLLSVEGTGLSRAPSPAAQQVAAAQPAGSSSAGDGRRGVYVTGLAAIRGSGTGLRIAHGRDLSGGELAGGEVAGRDPAGEGQDTQPYPVEAVVSARLARELVGAEGAAALGRGFEIQGRECRVAGVVAGRRAERVLMAWVPLGAAEALMVPSPQPRARTLHVRGPGIDTMPAIKQAVRGWKDAHRPGWKNTVVVSATGEERLRQASEGVLLFKILMGSFTAISLLVGGIGIMNVLLASVAERTREIGIRKAVGASRGAIIAQFLAESVAISLAGSLAGVVLGLAGAALVTFIMRIRTEALIYAGSSAGTIAVSIVAAVSVGLLFGTYPALRAARLSPLDAITRE